MSLRSLAAVLVVVTGVTSPPLPAQPVGARAERDSLPTVPAGFDVALFAREPLVRQPCSMAFDSRGRLFVGMGPQYRNPKPDTPGDSVVLIQDTDGDGVADRTKVFATGFNCVQGLAWHGRDLWVANAPDLTIVRDLDGDDEADEYVRVYTDLGNLEHGLHGLNWAPDGKLYMSKGNSKGLTRPGRIAPKPFRDLWGVTAPPRTPDFPEPKTYKKGDYKLTYHDPADDWGREGGVLRCDDGGHNLEIVSRGMRNPWDITADSGFNWLGTDNDQTEGDRLFMPFCGAHFGWNHPWSSHWGVRPHAPTAPVSGPLFEGSGTGIVFCESPQFPPAYRGVFLVNDWLRKTTFVWKPKWDGALMRPDGGTWEPMVQGGKSLFRPTDLEIGPDGALWILGWGNGYGAEWKDGQLKNEGRIFRVSGKDAGPGDWNSPKRARPLAKWTVAELVADFNGPLPVWRIDAADELVRRGGAVKDDLIGRLRSGKLATMQETWTAWTLGRMEPKDAAIFEFFTTLLSDDSTASLNLRIQTLRILAHRVREFGQPAALPARVLTQLRSSEARVRFAAVEAVVRARQQQHVPALLDLLAIETDPVTFYAGWQGLRQLQTPAELPKLLEDRRGGVRKAALLALLEAGALKKTQVLPLANDPDAGTREVAALWLGETSGGLTARPAVPATEPAPTGVSLIVDLRAKSKHPYRSVPGGARPGTRAYTDRDYRLTDVPPAMVGAELIQTANEDDGSSGKGFLSFEAMVPIRVHVGHDTRIKTPPAWLRDGFRRSDVRIATGDGTFVLYSREFPEGPVELGGNTDDGRAGGKSHYLVLLEPLPLAKVPTPATKLLALELLPKGRVRQGEVLFKQVAGCVKCHSLGERKNAFGPPLDDIGRRATAEHIVQSIVEPDAVITEGFSQLVIETTDGKVHTGTLIEESGISLTLGLPNGEPLTIRKDRITERRTTKLSAMPQLAPTLTAQQVADLTAFLLTRQTQPATPGTPTPQAKPEAPQPVKPVIAADSKFGLELKPDRLIVTHAGRPLADYVFDDPKILRPYFSNIHAPGGAKVTRNHPPIAGKDATDHDTMHPGLWLGFGDVSGTDFWRNKGIIKHTRFIGSPTATREQVTFATECRLLSADGKPLATLVNRYTLATRPAGWLLIWDATFRSDDRDFTFGDQEEMGFGARVATELTEKNGGTILSSNGKKTAKETWGQPAAWCDYSGTRNGLQSGITLMASPRNLREPWWHNRDYGVFVANPFGRAAMRQGGKSEVAVKKGEPLRLVFGAVFHEGTDYDPAGEYKHFREWVK